MAAIPSTEIAVLREATMTLIQPSGNFSLAQIQDLSERFVATAGQSIDVAVIQDLINQWVAFDTYVGATFETGRASTQATLRKLELRLGDVLNDASAAGMIAGRGDRHSSKPKLRDLGLSPNRSSEVRKMANNRPAVEKVIEESTDEKPATRNRVMKAIDEATKPPTTQPVAQSESEVKDSPQVDVPVGGIDLIAAVEAKTVTSKQLFAALMHAAGQGREAAMIAAIVGKFCEENPERAAGLGTHIQSSLKKTRTGVVIDFGRLRVKASE